MRFDPRRLPHVPPESTASRGPAWLYVLPCAYEDLLKLGFSRDPLARMQSIHPRWYEFFDLDRAMAVQAETAREAQAMETRYKQMLVEHSAPAPLIASAAAGGNSEWYRGAYAALDLIADELVEAGYIAQRPLRPWVRERLLASADRLYSWTRLLTADDLEDSQSIAPRLVRNVLDAYRALGIELAPWLPSEIYAWHRGDAD
jgi:hypothetical protein